MQGLLSLPGQGLRARLGPGNESLCKLQTENTWGTYEVFERTLAPGVVGAPPHLHRQSVQVFYITRGTATFQVGSRTEQCPPGTLCAVPRNCVHSYRNDGGEPVEMLMAMVPGGYYHEFYEALSRDPGADELARLRERYDAPTVPEGFTGTKEGYLSHPGEGPVYPFEPESIVRYKLTGEHTFGQIECYEREVPANTIGADPHVHYSNVETFYVVEGHTTIQIGERRVSYAPGTIVVAPLTAVNGFANESDKPCKLFIFFTPSRNHHLYFQGLANLKHGDPAHYAAGIAELRRHFDSDTA